MESNKFSYVKNAWSTCGTWPARPPAHNPAVHCCQLMPTYSWARVPPLCTGPRPSCTWCSWSEYGRCSGSSLRPHRHTCWCSPSASLRWPAQQPAAVAAARCPSVPSWRAVSAACCLPSIYRTQGWSPSPLWWPTSVQRQYQVPQKLRATTSHYTVLQFRL